MEDLELLNLCEEKCFDEFRKIDNISFERKLMKMILILLQDMDIVI